MYIKLAKYIFFNIYNKLGFIIRSLKRFLPIRRLGGTL